MICYFEQCLPHSPLSTYLLTGNVQSNTKAEKIDFTTIPGPAEHFPINWGHTTPPPLCVEMGFYVAISGESRCLRSQDVQIGLDIKEILNLYKNELKL